MAETLEASALIIGAGASGGVAARVLAEAGIDVLCLEQGEWPDEAKFVGNRPEWEILADTRWNSNPNIRLLEADYPLEVSECPVDPMMSNGVGGSTLMWGGVWHRLTPSDFRVHSLDGVGVDWPISYDELTPYYDRVEAELGISGCDGDPAWPDHAPYPLPALPINKTGDTLSKAMDRLGWHWWPGSNAIPSRSFDGRNACVRRAMCGIGCGDGAKVATYLTHWPQAVAAGCRLITGARVREITINAQGQATGAVFLDRSGAEHFVKASVVIVCANGIGTARLLLMSRSSLFPDGLANSSGLVGRNLMLHPTGSVVGTFAENLEGWIGPQGQQLYSMEFYNTDHSRGFVRGSKWSVFPHGGPLGFAMGMGYGEEMLAGVKAVFGRSIVLGIFAEDLPEERNGVELDPELTDSDGLPAPRIVYNLADNTRAILEFNIARATEALNEAGAAGVGSMLVNPAFGGAHLMGTARMGRDPKSSVTNRDGRTHDIPNLFIYDGSVFPTGGAVNPTATIMANALRSAEQLVKERYSLKVPA